MYVFVEIEHTTHVITFLKTFSIMLQIIYRTWN